MSLAQSRAALKEGNVIGLTENNLTRAIAAVQERIDAADAETMSKLDDEMAVSFEEHFAFQSAQARAHAMGKLTTDEAQVIYVALGEVGSPSNGGWASGTDLATKVTVTMLMPKLLKP